MIHGRQSEAELMRVLRAAQAERFLCECAFSYDECHRYCYVLGSSDRLICFAVEDDFLLNGFVIGRLSDLRLAKPCGALFDRMCGECGLPGQLKPLQIDLSSWESVFCGLQRLGRMIIVENNIPGKDFFQMGYVTDVAQSYIVFRSVDAEGVWTDHVMIAYDAITNVTFCDRYSATWQKYLSAHGQA